ncbi:hypothetical protein HDU99_010408, partial [Rhizoclosmatium hyalinum]
CFGSYIQTINGKLERCSSHCPHIPLTYQLVLFHKLLASDGCPARDGDHHVHRPI